MQPVSLYGSSEYSNAIGSAKLFLSMDKTPIGFYDTYDFNLFPIRWGNMEAQFKTSLVWGASLFNSSAKNFIIKYP